MCVTHVHKEFLRVYVPSRGPRHLKERLLRREVNEPWQACPKLKVGVVRLRKTSKKRARARTSRKFGRDDDLDDDIVRVGRTAMMMMMIKKNKKQFGYESMLRRALPRRSRLLAMPQSVTDSQ